MKAGYTMFGIGGGSSEEKIIKLVSREDWGALSSYLSKDTDTKIALASACSSSKSYDAINLMVRLLDDSDETVKFAAIATLAKIGTDHETAALQLLMMKTPKENEKLRNAIVGAVQGMRGRR